MTRDEQATVEAIWDLLHQQEKHRVELRIQDDHWRDRAEKKLDGITVQLQEVPCLMDAKIAHCRDERVEDTQGAVEFATGLKNFIIVLVKVAAFCGVATGAVFGVGHLFGWY